jgi:predicted amidohydrolase YtcJ
VVPCWRGGKLLLSVRFRLKNKVFISLGALSLVLLCSNPQAQQAGQPSTPAPADVIFLGANIITVDPATEGAEAVAIRADRIIAVGDSTHVLGLRGEATRVIELGGQALLPGFIDSHGHVGNQARILAVANLAPPPVGSVSDIARLQQSVRQYIAAREIPAGQWVLGFGYDDSLLAESRHPTRDDLDAVSTDHPILLMHISGHLGAVNSAALALLGINAETANPPGGVIRRRAGSNEPDGVLEEAAVITAYFALPQPGPEVSLQLLLAAQEFYASKGITTVQEGAATPQDMELLRAAASQQKLLLDFVAFAYWQADKAPMPALEGLGQYSNRFKPAGIKLVLDGSPQGKTAYLSQPYSVPPHGLPADYHGYPAYPAETVDRAVHEVLAQHIPLIAHANGDAAAEMLVNAVDKATGQLSVADARVVMIHAQTVRDDQLDRMAELGMIPSFFSAHTFFWGDWHRESVLGPLRADRISPTRSALDHGIPFTVHNDAPITPPDPIAMLWSTATRRTRSNDILGPAQRVPVYEAIKALTINGAHQYFEESSKGSITPGKLADLVVLSANPLQTEPEKLRELSVDATWSHGVEVFAREP